MFQKGVLAGNEESPKSRSVETVAAKPSEFEIGRCIFLRNVSEDEFKSMAIYHPNVEWTLTPIGQDPNKKTLLYSVNDKTDRKVEVGHFSINNSNLEFEPNQSAEIDKVWLAYFESAVLHLPSTDRWVKWEEKSPVSLFKIPLAIARSSNLLQMDSDNKYQKKNRLNKNVVDRKSTRLNSSHT